MLHFKHVLPSELTDKDKLELQVLHIPGLLH